MNLHELMVIRDSGTRTVDKYLMSYEGPPVAVRRHPAMLLQQVGEVVGGLILAGVITGTVGAGPGMLIWWLWLALLGRLTWKVITWSIEFFVVTEHRVMLITGVLNRKVAMMPMTKVTDIALERPIVGRFIGYGTFVLESAGQDQALREVEYMPYPEQLYLEVSSMIFPATD
ncbi:MAG: PH domain-containing protein [Actinomadura sp.]